MMAQVQSSPATDHRFCPIIGCSAVAGQPCDSIDSTVTPETGTWGHGVSQPFQCLAARVTPVTPYSIGKTCGKQAGAKGRLKHGAHDGWANIATLGSLGSQTGTTGRMKLSADQRSLCDKDFNDFNDFNGSMI